MPPLMIFAAGSLRDALTKLADVYTQRTKIDTRCVFGPSGVLRERIENGEPADLFLSADVHHPRKLSDQDLAVAPRLFAHNELCLFGHVPVKHDMEALIDTLMSPYVRLGTSTPGDDPGGDYAFQVFKQIENVRPGAFKILSSKSLQLVGGLYSPPVPQGKHPVLHLLETRQIDLFLGYFTAAQLIKKEMCEIQIRFLPQPIRVNADYHLTALHDAHPSTESFIEWVAAPGGKAILQSYGFAVD